MKKSKKLQHFLQSIKVKQEQKLNVITCPDCNSVLYKHNDDSLKLCICYGEFQNNLIKLTKSQNGNIKFNFPQSFGVDNLEMIMDAFIKAKNKQNSKE